MAYGTVKVDNITFTNGGIDQTVTVSGIVQSISGNITATGTIQAATIIGTSTVSGATVTGNAGVFTTVTGGSAGFTTVTGTTVTGTTANFATISGTTITGGAVTVASGTFSGNSTAAAFIPTGSTVPTNGLYLPAANSVALSTNGTGRLFVDANGNINLGLSAALPTISTGNRVFTLHSNGGAAEIVLFNPDANDTAFSHLTFGGIRTNTGATARISANRRGEIVFANNDAFNGVNTVTERLRITSAGLVGIGTSSPITNLHVVGTSGSGTIQIGNGNSNSQYHYLNLGGSTSSHDAWQLGRSPSGGVGPANGFYLYDLKNSATRLVVNSAGNVGIGTTSPIRLFHALDSANSIVGRVESGQSSSWLQFAASGTGTASRIGDPGGSTNAGLAFMTADTERARIDSSGRLLVGTSTASTFYSGGTANLQTQSTASTFGLGIERATADSGHAYMVFRKTRSTTPDGRTIVQNGDGIGSIVFAATDGTTQIPAAVIETFVDGTPGANDMPGRLVFSTTADGAASPTERMRITQSGAVLCGTTTTPTGAGGGSLVAQDRLVLAAEGAGRVQIRAGDTGTVTASTGTVVFRFKSNTASINLSAFVKITVSQRANSATASNSPAAEYCFQLHQNSSNAISLNGATTTFEYTYVRGTHFAFADAGSNECTVTLTNPTGVSLAGSYKVEIMSHAGLWVLQSVSST